MKVFTAVMSQPIACSLTATEYRRRAAESQCCPFLAFALEAKRERLVLDVSQSEPTGEEQ